jgi:hypothetical protein
MCGFRDDLAHHSEMTLPGMREGEATPAVSREVRAFGLSEGGTHSATGDFAVALTVSTS